MIMKLTFFDPSLTIYMEEFTHFLADNIFQHDNNTEQGQKANRLYDIFSSKDEILVSEDDLELIDERVMQLFDAYFKLSEDYDGFKDKFWFSIGHIYEQMDENDSAVYWIYPQRIIFIQ